MDMPIIFYEYFSKWIDSIPFHLDRFIISTSKVYKELYILLWVFFYYVPSNSPTDWVHNSGRMHQELSVCSESFVSEMSAPTFDLGIESAYREQHVTEATNLHRWVDKRVGSLLVRRNQITRNLVKLRLKCLVRQHLVGLSGHTKTSWIGGRFGSLCSRDIWSLQQLAGLNATLHHDPVLLRSKSGWEETKSSKPTLESKSLDPQVTTGRNEFCQSLGSSRFLAGRNPVFDLWDSLDKFEGWSFADHSYQFVWSRICSCIWTWCGSSFPQLRLWCGLWTSWKIETLDFFEVAICRTIMQMSNGTQVVQMENFAKAYSAG